MATWRTIGSRVQKCVVSWSFSVMADACALAELRCSDGLVERSFETLRDTTRGKESVTVELHMKRRRILDPKAKQGRTGHYVTDTNR